MDQPKKWKAEVIPRSSLIYIRGGQASTGGDLPEDGKGS